MRTTSTSVTPLSPTFGATLEELEARKQPGRARRRRLVVGLLSALFVDGVWRSVPTCVVWCRFCGPWVPCPDVLVDFARWSLRLH